MSTALMPLNGGAAQLPAHLAAFGDKENVVARETTPALTFRGKTWRLRQGGEELVLTRKGEDGDDVPVQSVQVVVLNFNPKRSRAFYANPFEEGKNQSPSCWSADGDRPDADVKTPCAATCAACPNSAKGSKVTPNGKDTTACSVVKRAAVVPLGKLDMEPLLLKIPQTSIWDKNNTEAEAKNFYAWDQYVDYLRARGVKHTAAVVTKVKFDPNVAYPKLLFTAVRWLEANEVPAVLPQVDSDAVKALLTGKIDEGGEVVEGAALAPAAQPAAPPAGGDDDDDAPVQFAQPASKPVAPPVAKPAAAKPKATAKPTAAPAVVTAPNSDLAALAAAWDAE